MIASFWHSIKPGNGLFIVDGLLQVWYSVVTIRVGVTEIMTHNRIHPCRGNMSVKMYALYVMTLTMVNLNYVDVGIRIGRRYRYWERRSVVAIWMSPIFILMRGVNLVKLVVRVLWLVVPSSGIMGNLSCWGLAGLSPISWAPNLTRVGRNPVGTMSQKDSMLFVIFL